MSLPAFKIVKSAPSSCANAYGETALPYAPSIRLSNGVVAVPQQYLDVDRTLETLENVLADITVPQNFLLFAGQEGDNLFIVAAVFGEENYPQISTQIDQSKIVYGRRWLIEPTTTTSEVVQTAMLAVKKAREHELREKLTITINNGANVTTPFNCHQDLPLMAGNQADVVVASKAANLERDELVSALARVSIDGMNIELTSLIRLGERMLVDCKVSATGSVGTFRELDQRSISVVCETPSISHFLHQLFNACLACSDRHVEENMRFKGFKRFSHDVSPLAIAEFSYVTRNVEIKDSRFNSEFADMSYRVDSSKAPQINQGALGDHQRQVLASFPQLAGYLPKEPSA